MGCLQSAWLQQISLCQSGSLSTAHGIYYDCYLPLYVFCGRHLLVAKRRRADLDAAAGAVEEIARIVAQVRRRWPRVRILLRADGGFARDDLMAWCEANGADFLFGLARNERLVCEIATELDLVAAKSRRTGRPERRFKSFMWTTRASWSCRRPNGRKEKPIRALSSPRSGATSARPSISTRSSTAPAVRWSGRIEARTGLRMMPTSPRSPLSFRTAGFPQYGWKAGLSDGAFPSPDQLKPAPGVR